MDECIFSSFFHENIVDKACDTVGDLVVCDDVEKNDAFTSIEQEFQGDIGASDYCLVWAKKVTLAAI
jgi:hypothetical protein